LLNTENFPNQMLPPFTVTTVGTLSGCSTSPQVELLRDNTEVGLVTLTNGHTLITAFSSERNQWMRAKCINIHDPQSPVYALTSEYEAVDSPVPRP